VPLVVVERGPAHRGEHADYMTQAVDALGPAKVKSRAVRELLPQLTRLNRTADLENEAEQER
jgi:Arc/MetJ family transcription regulator